MFRGQRFKADGASRSIPLGQFEILHQILKLTFELRAPMWRRSGGQQSFRSLPDRQEDGAPEDLDIAVPKEGRVSILMIKSAKAGLELLDAKWAQFARDCGRIFRSGHLLEARSG